MVSQKTNADQIMTRHLKIGDRIADNDPRMAPRVLTITTMDERYVFAAARGQETRIQRRNVYTDGKQRRTGFSLVKEGSE
jgi:hypothetical protein